MNLCVFTGYFLRDPEPRQINNTNVLNFKLAIVRKFKKSSGETSKQTSILDFEIWDSACDTVVDNFKKGDYITVTCSARSFLQEMEDGKKIPRVIFRVNEFEFPRISTENQEEE
jgi:single-stranded DNA-binding protein